MWGDKIQVDLFNNMESAQRAMDDALANSSSNISERIREYLVLLDKCLKCVSSEHPGAKLGELSPSWPKEKVVSMREDAEKWVTKINSEQDRVRKILDQISNES